MTERYLEPHQAGTGSPTGFEDALADTIEEAYATGIHDLDGLVARLNDRGPAHPEGVPWTGDGFTKLMADLGR